jgi:hypothetical protein
MLATACHQSFVTPGLPELILLLLNKNLVRTLHNCGVFTLPPDPYLENRALSYAPAIEFLGLLHDSKFTWEPHLRWLHIECERSVS